MNDTNDAVDAEVPLLKEKPIKKPRTQKQIDAFLKASTARQASVENKMMVKKIEASKLLLGLNIPITDKAIKHQHKPIQEDDFNTENESDSSVEEIIVKRAKKKKKKKRVIVMEDSSSEEDEPEPRRPQPRHTISQQNKKSIIKVHHS